MIVSKEQSNRASSKRRLMYPALGLVPAALASRAAVFAGVVGGGAGDAADRRIARCFEWVARQFVLGEIALEVGLAPVGEQGRS